MSMLRSTLIALAAAAPLLGAPALAQAPAAEAPPAAAPAAEAPPAPAQPQAPAPAQPQTGAQPQAPADAGAAARTTTDPQVRQALPPASQTQQQLPQDDGAGPPQGSSEVQAPVPEVQSAGETGQRQVPNSADPEQPTGTPAAPQPQVAPTPVQPIPAPPPLGNRNLSAEELELQSALTGRRITGIVSIPDDKLAVLVQPEGRDWRAFRNSTMMWIGGVAILGVLAVLALFFLVRGRIRMRHGPSGRTMQRFNFLERSLHWLTASTFIVLALSGLNLVYGRHLLRPVIGPEAFTTVSELGKIAHNFLAFPFTLGVLGLLALWVRDNIPNKLDWVWLKNGGGFIGDAHPQAGRFNGGQKAVFWITVLGGGAVAASGFLLMFPFFVLNIEGQQIGHMLHSVLSMLMIAAMLAHIYIGSLGMEGAFSAMGSGKVDYNWAREHHSMWVDDELKRAHESVRPEPATRPAGAD
ncbi:formate dehydrogenase subunit gamma [Teichococcus aestuarii]|uniref:formate dehydrogenase subunit gamma n=1 Tax=Teichococcus aestuarii TaxID=568898 RepID=UPI001FE69A6E|nr:formate dehydrogenase subunit gamma [Pseudoroseomonas aestuarii]